RAVSAWYNKPYSKLYRLSYYSRRPDTPISTPPTGTVTFLFTDIEGSTRRWEEQSQAMSAVLTRHDAILRTSIEQHGGYIFKTVGDAFYAAFPTPISALEAALDTQRALLADDSSPHGPSSIVYRPEPLRVRMALHSGMVETRDGDYF